MKVRYSPRATRQLEELYEYVELASGSERAAAFVGSTVDYCERLGSSRIAARSAMTSVLACEPWDSGDG